MTKRSADFKHHPEWSMSRFWSFIRSALRAAWLKYPVRYKVLDSAKVKYDGPDKRTKWLYRCNVCKSLVKSKEIQVDHLIDAGSLKDYSDLPGFVERLFCGEEHLQAICVPCHKKLTQERKK